jgi:thiol-disulfide isomerase/thioredoxin
MNGEVRFMKYQFALLAFLMFPLPQTSTQRADQAIPLERMVLTSTGPFVGISNLFFDKLQSNQVRRPADWNEVEISPLLQNPAFAPISVIRYKAGTGLTYVVDTNADLDFGQESALQFVQAGDMKIADIEVTVRPVGSDGGASRKVSYQILLSNDGYTYGRISEYRQGEIRIGDKTYGISLRPRGRNSPSFSLSGNTTCLIDLNRDGDFSERWRISDKGEITPREEIELPFPFVVGGEKVRIVSLDPAGTALRIETSSDEISISPGFKAPGFTLKGVDSSQYSLSSLKGKIVFLEFWSVSCPFCKRILPEVNSLIKKNAGSDFVALAVSREEDSEEITKDLRENPRNAVVVVNDKATWQTYDSQGITPTYYLIDTRGVIRLSGYGASSDQLKVIERLVELIRRGG